MFRICTKYKYSQAVAEQGTELVLPEVKGYSPPASSCCILEPWVQCNQGRPLWDTGLPAQPLTWHLEGWPSAAWWRVCCSRSPRAKSLNPLLQDTEDQNVEGISPGLHIWWQRGLKASAELSPNPQSPKEQGYSCSRGAITGWGENRTLPSAAWVSEAQHPGGPPQVNPTTF